MRVPRLVSRRQLWLPTLSGWLAIAAAFIVALTLAARALHPFLATEEPVPGARILVVEGWMGQEALQQAAAAIRRGAYRTIVTTGGPNDAWPRSHATYADRAADYLRQAGIPMETIVAVPTPRSFDERTYRSAIAVREWARQSGTRIDALDVYSDGTHARRSRLLYRAAFGEGIQVGVRAARPADYDPDTWWRTSVGARHVLDEAIGFAWVAVFFRPRPEPSHEEADQ